MTHADAAAVGARCRNLANWLKQETGIEVSEKKMELVIRRFCTTTGSLAQFDPMRLAALSKTDRDGLINLFTVNESSFFRDRRQFDFLSSQALPLLLPLNSNCRGRVLKVLSLGCSAGEEPFSLAMTILDFLSTNPRPGLEVKVLGGDINTKKLEDAQRGVFLADSRSMKSLSNESRRMYMTPDGEGNLKVISRVRRLVEFTYLNLAKPCFGLSPEHICTHYDVIFCRNVLIYFTESEKSNILKVISNILSPSGFLFLGYSETLRKHPEFNSADGGFGTIYTLGEARRPSLNPVSPVPAPSRLHVPPETGSNPAIDGTVPGSDTRVISNTERVRLIELLPSTDPKVNPGKYAEFLSDLENSIHDRCRVIAIETQSAHMVSEEVIETIIDAARRKRKKSGDLVWIVPKGPMRDRMQRLSLHLVFDIHESIDEVGMPPEKGSNERN